MHPILTSRRRLGAYLVTWLIVAAMFAAAMALAAGRPVLVALAVFLPASLLHAFVGLASWYVARSTPISRTPFLRLLFTHLVAGAVSSGLFVFAVRLSGTLTASFLPGIDRRDLDAVAPVFWFFGLILYLLAVALHYVLLSLEAARATEERRLELKVMERDAELRALRAQVDPHFLFNSLNSISALCGSNPSSARTMTILLAEYLRKSLRMSDRRTITLSEELELASSYLAIERVRFGDRLQFEQVVDEAAREFVIPPLLIQPLVENAVTHGIAHRLEGGLIRIEARADGNRVHVRIENSCDADAPPSRGAGVGMENVRRRVETFYGRSGSMHGRAEGSVFRVDLTLGVEG